MPAIALRLPLFVGGWLLTTALLLVHLGFLHRSFARLRESHPATWQELGQPRVFSGKGAYRSARAFLWSKQCQKLGDAFLTRQARLSYFFGMAAAVLGLAIVAVLAYNAAIRVL